MKKTYVGKIPYVLFYVPTYEYVTPSSMRSDGPQDL